MEENNQNPSPTNSNWYDAEGIDKSLITDKLKGFTNSDGSMNIAELLKSYNTAQSYLGASVRIPTEKSTPEEVAAFYSKLGRPESAEKYDWKVPDGYTSIEENFKKFKELCFGLGMSNKQVSGVFDGWLQSVKDIETAQAAELAKIKQANFDALSDANVWGDKAADKISVLQKKLGTINDGKALAKLQAAGLDSDADILLMLENVLADADGSRMAQAASGGKTAAEEIAELQKNPAYTNPNHPEHNKVVARINDLFQKK